MSTTAIRERPILFSGPMVRAILDGTKTQTRRVVKPQPFRSHWLQKMWGTSPPPNPVEFGEKYLWREVGADYPDGAEDERRCPYGVPGDRLWVRETHYVESAGYRDGTGRRILYKATEPDAPTTWTPSIHMPRWASRITLEITDVRVERLQAIGWNDAVAEGVRDPRRAVRRIDNETGCVAKYRDLWDSINTKRGFGWSVNPWVWVIVFRRVTA